MNLKSLKTITRHLENVLDELKRNDLQDREIRHRYAEFLVARILAKRGHTVQLLRERKDKCADIYLIDEKKRVEVKSCCADEDGWRCASFGVGNQIKKKMFDYCVFVAFGKYRKPKILVFEREELIEVAKIRRGIASHEKTNPCLLMYAPTPKDYDDFVKECGPKVSIKIERMLNKYPRRFEKAWHKIK